MISGRPYKSQQVKPDFILLWVAFICDQDEQVISPLVPLIVFYWLLCDRLTIDPNMGRAKNRVKIICRNFWHLTCYVNVVVRVMTGDDYVRTETPNLIKVCFLQFPVSDCFHCCMGFESRCIVSELLHLWTLVAWLLFLGYNRTTTALD